VEHKGVVLAIVTFPYSQIKVKCFRNCYNITNGIESYMLTYIVYNFFKLSFTCISFFNKIGTNLACIIGECLNELSVRA
jgi:hypothetical protein